MAPVPIENEIKAAVPFLSNVMLIGDKCKYLSCLVTLKVCRNEFIMYDCDWLYHCVCGEDIHTRILLGSLSLWMIVNVDEVGKL